MPTWIREPGQQENPQFFHHFTFTHDPSSGLMFDLDPETREPIFRDDEDRARYAHAQAEVTAGRMEDQGVMDCSTSFWDAGAIRCHCGSVVDLTDDWEGAACQKCGTEYGSNGQMFRANWREFCRETGELTDELDE